MACGDGEAECKFHSVDSIPSALCPWHHYPKPYLPACLQALDAARNGNNSNGNMNGRGNDRRHRDRLRDATVRVDDHEDSSVTSNSGSDSSEGGSSRGLLPSGETPRKLIGCMRQIILAGL